MVDRIDKALRELTPKRRQEIERLILLINEHKLSGLDLKKLRGTDDIYRVRKGNIRIIFNKTTDSIFILAIERRADTTYNKF